ncbi:MAG: hypothetical protein ABEK50_17740, partial [bacterium]
MSYYLDKWAWKISGALIVVLLLVSVNLTTGLFVSPSYAANPSNINFKQQVNRARSEFYQENYQKAYDILSELHSLNP